MATINDIDKDNFDLSGFIAEQSSKKDLTERERLMLYWLNELNARPNIFIQSHESPPDAALLETLKLQSWVVKQTVEALTDRVLVTIAWTGRDKPVIDTSTPEPTSTEMFLDVPYRSQWDADASTHVADCGPTALAMVLNAVGVATTPDTIYARFMPGKPATAYTSVDELRQAAAGYNTEFDVTTFDGDTVTRIKETIDRNEAIIALVNYEHLDARLNNFNGAHFLIIVGYDDKYIYVHDPLYNGATRGLGAYKAWEHERFMRGWNDCAKQGNPNLLGMVCRKLAPKLMGRPTPQQNAKPPLYKAKVDNPNAIGGLWARGMEDPDKAIRFVANGELVEVFELFDLNADYPKRARITPDGAPAQHVVYEIGGVEVLEKL